MNTSIEASLLTTGFSWTECPRWHAGRFYFTDLFSARVVTVDAGGRSDTVLDLSDRIALDGQRVVLAGTGFLPDGRMVVNSMFEQLVLVYDGESVSIHADLRRLAIGPINDMVVDASGRIYVTQLGFNVFEDETPRESPILIVEPDGSSRIADEAGPLVGANGIAISADGSTLVTAETFAKRIAAFDIGADGKLGPRRTFAEIDGHPDGLCLDETGAAWAGLPDKGLVVRVVEGGEITDVVSPPAAECGITTACGLGGDDRRTLYVCCGFEVMDFEKSVSEGKGSIWTARVPISAGATRP
ncbi:SMP-30/gluconolactonase/LRE family protein [Prescottella agglutinans]|uniref:Sugar lactone lactonase YvrE n=1 Tax=Prescottella agglutinans TaxID=1644129 RepID=A0ABT6M9F3_9NOCA|nr:SMP-30/gluconolactonase/LRE family protein [Prescottella agglutinans]MDH6280943.1 sugar lactone lactonase YvrE [Prescottella agglutinans]